VVSEEHRLRALQMGVAGQVGVPGPVARRSRVRCSSSTWPITRASSAPREKPQRSGDLIVPTSARVELRPALKSELGPRAVRSQCDVLVGLEILEAVACQLGTHLIKGLDSESASVTVRIRPQEPMDVRYRAPHIVSGQPFVEGQARSERHQGVGGAAPIRFAQSVTRRLPDEPTRSGSRDRTVARTFPSSWRKASAAS